MSRLLMIAVPLTIVLPSSAAAQTVIPVGEFRSVELRNGGHVIVRHGQRQRVTILEGDLRYTRVRLGALQRLLIDNCNPDCPRKYRMRIEIITPEISAASVSNGGTLQSVGAFPVQPSIEARIEQGGTIDIRSIPAAAVEASVYSGGGIFTSPRETLAATVVSGGRITYWGDVRVRQSVRDGGVVERGTAADAGKPLLELCPPLPVIPPLPPVPPIPPH